MSWLRAVIILVLCVALGLAGAGFWMLKALSTPVERSEPVLVSVNPGQAFSQIARDFHTQGLVSHPGLWKFYAIATGDAERVQAGEYEFYGLISPREILRKLVAGEVTRYSFTIVEGLTVSEMMDMLHRHPKIRRTLDDWNEETLMAALGKPELPAEGQFLADTYHFPAGTTDIDLLTRAHQALQQALAEQWAARSVGIPLQSPYEALIMASIIEKETGVEEERTQISGVFSRRLLKGMRLQTDPTVIYGLGDSYNGNLKRKHLSQDTPWNTYTRHGLPPTPIALVGPAAIQAALQPDQSNSLYFVARGDGSHFFSDTLEEHNRAVRKYQLNRTENYRSSPIPKANDN